MQGARSATPRPGDLVDVSCTGMGLITGRKERAGRLAGLRRRRWGAGDNDSRTTLLICSDFSPACRDGLFFLKQISVCTFPRWPII